MEFIVQKTEPIKPMKGDPVKDLNALTYPIYAQPKIDGIRCLVHPNGTYQSTSGKVLPNRNLPELGLHKIAAKYNIILDGELQSFYGFQHTSSVVMSHNEELLYLDYHCFDFIALNDVKYTFHERWMNMKHDIQSHEELHAIFTTLLKNPEHVQEYYDTALESGYEGIMLRSPNGIYKHGRSTNKEQFLLKLKPTNDLEAEIIGFEPLRRGIESDVDEFGKAKPIHRQENKIATECLGSFICLYGITDIEFSVGTGFLHEQRMKYWEHKDELIGKIIRVKYQNFTEDKKPRFPVFDGFRDIIDLTEY